MKFKITVGIACIASMLLAGCGDSEDGSSDSTSPGTAPIGTDLREVCPSTVVFQTDWNPESEHGFLYELVGPGYSIDAAKLRVTGDLMSNGERTGVKVEVRAGGPAVNYGQVTSVLYQDPEIMLGFVSTDEAVSHSADFPTVAVVAPFAVSPQIIMWDPEMYPNVKTIADLKDEGVKVRYRDGVTFMEYFVQSGILDAAQVDATYDGTPAAFVASGGKDAQQGFGTSEPYFYTKVLKDWSKPIAYQYVNDAGWTSYAQSLAGTPENIRKHAGCLEELVPIIQQATVDFITSPSRTNELILDLVDKYANGWVYDSGQASSAVSQMLEDELVANGPDGALGSFDLERMEKFIQTATPVFQKSGTKIKQDLRAEDLATNEFIDATISLD